MLSANLHFNIKYILTLLILRRIICLYNILFHYRYIEYKSCNNKIIIIMNLVYVSYYNIINIRTHNVIHDQSNFMSPEVQPAA